LRILFISCWYPTKENPLKGIFVKEHARAIHSSGEKIVVLGLNVTSATSFYNKRIEKVRDDQGIETHIIHIESFFYKWIYINPFHLYSILRRYFKDEIQPGFDPDIIHSNILNPCAILGDWLSAEYKKPHIITEHWSKIDKYMRKNILSSYGKKAYENAKIITAVSQFLKSGIDKYILKPDKVKIVPNVIDTDLFNFLPKISSDDKMIFSCVATWTPPKQPMLFVNALEKISKNSSKKIELNMVGEGIQLEEVRNANASYQINYHGNLSRQKIAELLQRSDYFFHASDIETFSMVCAEALATGTPVIASRVGGIPEFVNESNGVLTGNTIEEWTQAIEKAANTKFDNSAISKNLTGRFSRAAVAKMFKEIYSSFLQV
jgi:glycosyltransferase involved in cell wall biosynthesis